MFAVHCSSSLVSWDLKFYALKVKKYLLFKLFMPMCFFCLMYGRYVCSCVWLYFHAYVGIFSLPLSLLDSSVACNYNFLALILWTLIYAHLKTGDVETAFVDAHRGTTSHLRHQRVRQGFLAKRRFNAPHAHAFRPKTSCLLRLSKGNFILSVGGWPNGWLTAKLTPTDRPTYWPTDLLTYW